MKPDSIQILEHYLRLAGKNSFTGFTFEQGAEIAVALNNIRKEQEAQAKIIIDLNKQLEELKPVEKEVKQLKPKK